MTKPGPYLKENLPGIYYFLVSLINGIRRIGRPYSIYITDSLGGSFKSYFISSDMTGKISCLKRDLDRESAETIDVIVQRFLHYPDERYKHRISKRSAVRGGILPVESAQNRNEVVESLKISRRKFNSLSKHIEESVFYYYHGLSLLPASVAEYIKDHDFIDAGAFIGDSAIALSEYNYRKIYSIEISLKSIEKYKANMAKNKIPSPRFELINVCISSVNHEAPVILADTGSSGLSLLRNSGKYDKISVEQKSIDTIVEEHGISPRFIKVDIEGNALEFVKGATKTLTKFRPVLSIAIYHNPYEFFEVKPFLENILSDYIFMIRKLSTGLRNNLCHSEVVLIGYPKEII